MIKKSSLLMIMIRRNSIFRSLSHRSQDVKKKLSLNALLLMLLLSATACEVEMPEPNEWRILEWTVDGERHKASCESEGLFGCTALGVDYNLNNGSFYLGGGKKIDGFSQHIYINIFRGLKLEERISFGEHDDMFYSITRNEGGCKRYRAINEDQRLLYISEIDSTNRIIEGYFEFEGANACQDTLQINDGYFKVSF